ncbi:MAG: RNA-binding domain-containing protein [Candidatus Heimdallarchaeaceae archaeon]
MTISISRIEFNLSIHATESVEKNMLALASIIPPNVLKHAKITKEVMEGGYQNPIQFIHITLTKTKEINDIIEHFTQKIAEEDKKRLYLDFAQRFDEERKRFYIRFDKEEAYKDKLVINFSPRNVKVEIRLKSYSHGADYKEYLVEKGILAPL